MPWPSPRHNKDGIQTNLVIAETIATTRNPVIGSLADPPGLVGRQRCFSLFQGSAPLNLDEGDPAPPDCDDVDLAVWRAMAARENAVALCNQQAGSNEFPCDAAPEPRAALLCGPAPVCATRHSVLPLRLRPSA